MWKLTGCVQFDLFMTVVDAWAHVQYCCNGWPPAAHVVRRVAVLLVIAACWVRRDQVDTVLHGRTFMQVMGPVGPPCVQARWGCQSTCMLTLNADSWAWGAKRCAAMVWGLLCTFHHAQATTIDCKQGTVRLASRVQPGVDLGVSICRTLLLGRPTTIFTVVLWLRISSVQLL